MAQILGPGDYTVLVPPIVPPVINTKIIVPAVHSMQAEQLWYEARDASAPHTGSHGTIDVTYNVNGPTVFNFKPIVLSSGHSDNIYLLKRLTSSVPVDLLMNATKFSQTVWFKVDNPSNVQAIELDLPTIKNQGTMGLQLLPGSPNWNVRAFVYKTDTTPGHWYTLSGVSISPTLLTQGFLFGGEYLCDEVHQQTTNIIVNDSKIPVVFSQLLGTPVSPRLNTAIQFDARGDAKPYTVSVDKWTITLQ